MKNIHRGVRFGPLAKEATATRNNAITLAVRLPQIDLRFGDDDFVFRQRWRVARGLRGRLSRSGMAGHFSFQCNGFHLSGGLCAWVEQAFGSGVAGARAVDNIFQIGNKES
jgi:hypothetical protein